jgi:hypothetical protein
MTLFCSRDFTLLLVENFDTVNPIPASASRAFQAAGSWLKDIGRRRLS